MQGDGVVSEEVASKDDTFDLAGLRKEERELGDVLGDHLNERLGDVCVVHGFSWHSGGFPEERGSDFGG